MENKVEKKGFGKWLPLGLLCLTQLGTSGDNTALSVATASLVESLNASMADIQLANLMYTMCAACLMIVGAMIGIIIGWKKNYIIGAAMCAVGEFVVAISTNVTMFTWAGRLIVGIGASLLVPSILALVPAVYKSGKDRAIAFGAIMAFSGLATCLAPIAAGAMIDGFGWRSAFYFLAAYFLILAIGSVVLGKVEKPKNSVRFDLIGTIVAVSGLFAFKIGITKITVWGFIEPINPPFTLFGISPALPLIILGIVVLYLFVLIERRVEAKHGSCLIPSAFLTTPQVRNGLYLTAYLFICFSATSFTIITYMQLVGGMSGFMSGVVLIVNSIPLMIASLGIPKYMPNVSPKLTCQIGVVLSAIGGLLMAWGLDLNGINWMAYAGLAVMGLGTGMISAFSSAVVAAAVNDRDAQQSGGIQAAIRNLGHGIGIAVLGVVMLFSMTGTMQSKVSANTEISSTAKSFISEQKSIAFQADKGFESLVSSHTENEKDVEELMKLNAETRQESTALSLYVFIGISVFVLFGTRNLPKGDKKQS